MVMTLNELKSIIREAVKKAFFHKITDDDSYKEKSYIVPDKIKDKINAYFDDMHL